MLVKLFISIGLKFADGISMQVEEEYQPLSTYRVLELLSDRVEPDTKFTGLAVSWTGLVFTLVIIKLTYYVYVLMRNLSVKLFPPTFFISHV